VSVITSRSHGLKLAEALGIPTHKLRSFVVRVPSRDVVTVEAVYLLEDHGSIVERVRRMRLAVLDEAPIEQ
jgi:hypothetical protein